MLMVPENIWKRKTVRAQFNSTQFLKAAKRFIIVIIPPIIVIFAHNASWPLKKRN